MSTKLYNELNYLKSSIVVLEDNYSFDEESGELVEPEGLEVARKQLADIESQIKELQSV